MTTERLDSLLDRRDAMRFFVKYNLYFLTVYALIMLGVLFAFWDTFSITQRFDIGFLVLFTLHMWEETKYPGGFVEMVGGVMNIDFSKAPEGLLELPSAILIVVLTLLPLLFPGVMWLFLAVMYLGLFEGVIHVIGIKLARPKKPYTPGTVTAIVLFVYSVFGVYSVVAAGLVAPLDWLLAFVVILGSLVLMELGVYRSVDLQLTDVMKHMRANIRKQP